MIYLFTTIDPNNSWYTHFLYEDGYIYRSYKMNNQCVIKEKLFVFGTYNSVSDTLSTYSNQHVVQLDRYIYINSLIFGDISDIKEHITRIIFDKL